MTWLRLWAGFLICGVAHSKSADDTECHLQDDLVREIHSHKALVDKIISEATIGSYAGTFYNDLLNFTDRFGYRKTDQSLDVGQPTPAAVLLLGTEGLEIAIKHLSNTLSKKELVVKLENVTVPAWVRGKEKAFYITSSRKKRLRLKALGNSAAGNVTAPLMVVKDIAELEARKGEAAGKIVLFNTEFKNYESTSVSRNEGPAKASHFEAVGALVRSITPFSIGSIHLGVTNFDGVKPIPAAAISLEDADLLARMIQKENVRIQLMITYTENGPVKNVSQNLIADIPGKSEPNGYFSLSGHIDSWDMGQGALDDGGGAFLAIHALLLLKHMKIEPPRRTMRAILWTGEEMGLYGAKAYAKTHANEIKNWTAAFESDSGLFEPLGFTSNGNKKASCILKEIASLFAKLNATQVERTDETLATDISVLKQYNVPLIEPLLKPNNYFWFHHSEGDSMRVMNSTLMDKHLALISGAGYILANLSTPLPREATRRFNSAVGRRRLSKSGN